jgi:hypothetical protein
MEPMQSRQTAYLVRQGIAAARSGRSAEARQLLEHAVQINSNDEMAWLWLSGLMTTVEQKLMCLRQVLRINPHNEYARAGLARLQNTLRAAGPVAALETRLAAVTESSASPVQNRVTLPAIKRLKPPSSASQQEPLAPKLAESQSSDALSCPACDHPLAPNMRVCPHCYLELKSLEELLARGDTLPPTQPLKPRRKGIRGR